MKHEYEVLKRDISQGKPSKVAIVTAKNSPSVTNEAISNLYVKLYMH